MGWRAPHLRWLRFSATQRRTNHIVFPPPHISARVIQIVAVARLTLTTCVRSRMVACVLLMLGAALVALPLGIRNTPSSGGTVRLMILYPLTVAAVILGAASLWLACQSFAHDIATKRIHLTLTKSIHPLQIWIGKWIGIQALNACFLLLCGVVLYGVIQHAHTDEEQATLPPGRLQVDPQHDSIEQEALAVAEIMSEMGQLSPDVSPRRSVAEISASLIQQHAIIPVGESRSWSFPLAPFVQPRRTGAPDVAMRFTLQCAATERTPVAGVWTIGTTDQPELHTVEIAGILDGTHDISIPNDLFANPAFDASNAPPLVASFVNSAGTKGTPSQPTVYIRPDDGVVFLIHTTGFIANLFRTLLVIFCYLACISALGLTAGALFSFPVALFSSASVVAALMLALATASAPPLSVDHHGLPVDLSVHQRIGEAVLVGIASVASPFATLQPIGLLANGILVSDSHVGSAVLVLGFGIPLAFALAGCFLMKRRELAL